MKYSERENVIVTAIFILKYVCTGRHTVFPKGTVCLFLSLERIFANEKGRRLTT